MNNPVRFLAGLLLTTLAARALTPSGLKTDFLENPKGIDTAKPRFVAKMASGAHVFTVPFEANP